MILLWKTQAEHFAAIKTPQSVTNFQENYSEAKKIEGILYKYINVTSTP